MRIGVVNKHLATAGLVLLIASVLWVLAGRAAAIDPIVYDAEAAGFWYQADPGAALATMSEWLGPHLRSQEHPFFTLVTFPLVATIRTLARCTPLEAALAAQFAALSGLLTAFYALLRRVGCRPLDALLGTAVLASASGIVFSAVVLGIPIWSALSVVLALLVLSRPAVTERDSHRRSIAAGLVAMSVTASNWAIALFGLVAGEHLRPAVRAVLVTFIVAAGISLVQAALFSGSGLFFLPAAGTSRPMPPLDLSAWAQRLAEFIVLPLQVPPPHSIARGAGGWAALTVSVESRWSFVDGRWAQTSAWLLWLGVLAGGALCLSRAQRRPVAMTCAAGYAVLQCAVHVIYAGQPLLRGAPVAACLVLVALAPLVLPAPAGARTILRAACAVLIATNVIFNLPALRSSIDRIGAQLTERDRLQAERAAGLGADWPSGRGHVLLGAPGDVVANKAYIDADGGFSPAPGSFGLGLVALDAGGAPLKGTDLKARTEEHFELTRGSKVPDLVVHTALADLRIVSVGPRRWTITVAPRPLPAGAADLGLQIRSIGPAGSALRSVRATSPGRIDIDDRWLLSVEPAPRSFFAGSEIPASAAAALTRFGVEAGDWQRGIAALPRSLAPMTLSIAGLGPAAAGGVDLPSLSLPRLSVPSLRFSESLAAQILHLGMGIDAGETRPGDPLNYTYEWARDGAYVLVALAASGNEAVAEELAPRFFAKDYFGGFGAEADAPGLSLWMLDEIVSRDPRSDLAGRLWPAIERKVALLRHCLDPGATFWRTTPLPPFQDNFRRLPMDLVCGPAIDGVVLGKMDNHFPVAYVTAATFGGLSAAARLAERAGHSDRAAAWRSLALQVQRGWTALAARTRSERRWRFAREFARPAVLDAIARDPRGSIRALHLMIAGYTCFECDPRYDSAALWPFGVGAPLEASVRSRVKAHLAAEMTPAGDFRTRPEWPYFDLELAHQLLLVGNRDDAWAILNWFFTHQLAAGLYTWGEGRHETNGPGNWDTIRGWVNAQDGVTPHYWAAAELLLLQLDMLARVAPPPPDRPDEPLVVQVGLGVPDAWLAGPLAVDGLSTRAGRVCWQWDTSQLTVTVPSGSIGVQGAGAFAGRPIAHVVGPCAAR